jgi:hypothetical protein
MQIGLTKKLAEAMGANPSPASEEQNPLFSWTANWAKVWTNRSENMLVLVNNATRFCVAIYQVKRKDLKNVAKMIRPAISNTLLFMNLNPKIVEEYMRLTGEVVFVPNKSRQAASWVTKAAIDCSFHIDDEYNSISKMFSDTVGASSNYIPVNCSANINDGFFPNEAMFAALSNLTGKQIYQYRAFELLVTLDLEIYKATRRIIVPANLEFVRLHEVLQSVFNWENRHSYEFFVFDGNEDQHAVRLLLSEEELDFDEVAVLMEGHVLSEFLPRYKSIRYDYDFGDGWEHKIELVRVIEDYDKESPYLVEASGQAPPEDVGGVEGFLEFREIMLNPDHPQYENLRSWSGHWSIELSNWFKSGTIHR